MAILNNRDWEIARALNTRVLERTVYLALDLGQRANHSALIALERFETLPDYTDMLRGVGILRRYVVRQAERIALGTPYSQVVAHVKDLIQQLRAKNISCVLVVDESGVGVPVVEAMQDLNMGCQIMPIAITSGQHSTARSVPRVELITKMQLMAQRGELEIARGCMHGEELKNELVHLQLSGVGAREQDDLALALALACWKAKIR